jgi:membrane protein DedA with SNARE-associated domain
VLSLLALLSAVAPALAPALAEPLTHAQRLWLYVTLAASPILTEELGALLGGVAVSQGQLRLVLAIFAVTAGGWLATTLLYVFGWWRGRWVRERFPSAGAAMKRWLRAVRRRPWRSALAVRFAFGARLLLPLACGAAHLRPVLYLVGSLVSSIVWSSLFVLLGFWFGDTAVGAIQVVRRYDQYAVGVVAGLAVVVGLILRRRRRARAAAAAATAAAATTAPVEPG